MASRARRRVQSETGPARFEVDPADQRLVAARFIEACAGGDLETLMRVLDPGVAGELDRGVVPIGPPLVGRIAAGRVLLRRYRTDPDMTLVSLAVNGEAGVLAFRGRRLFGILVLTEQDGLITHVHAIADPNKLAIVSSLVGAAPR